MLVASCAGITERAEEGVAYVTSSFSSSLTQVSVPETARFMSYWELSALGHRALKHRASLRCGWLLVGLSFFWTELFCCCFRLCIVIGMPGTSCTGVCSTLEGHVLLRRC